MDIGDNRYLKVALYYYFPRAACISLFFMVSNLLNILKNWSRMNLGNDWVIFWTTLGLFMLDIVNTIGVVIVTYFAPFIHFIMFGKHYSIYKFEDKIFYMTKEFCYSNGKLVKQ